MPGSAGRFRLTGFAPPSRLSLGFSNQSQTKVGFHFCLIFHKSFIIQGFDDFCGVIDADLRLPLR
jgi:hypothetical protein